MADLETALTTYLLTQSGLTALIGNRIQPEEQPQNSDLPAVVYITVSDVKEHFLIGQAALEQPYIQFTVYAKTKPSAIAVSVQLKTALNDYHGTLSSVVIQKIELVNELPGLETSADGTTRIHTLDLEYQIFYERG